MQPITPDDATQVHAPSQQRPATAVEPQFTPGAMVADRYRIVSLLGSGGMGEVYRADDVKLGQRVALKYIPPRVSIEQLYKEVRIGREISHPNVCRLHDIVEVEGQRFISMEYVDGEDLASLLRRIGRLPSDKALALARDLCSGLAAAHDRGFIHRDLKPANVMIDGRGSARITDFGLAALAAEGARDFGGTPLYMAPEQLEHGTSTTRSDIYSLGLVLFEMITGRRVFDAKTTTDLRAQHSMTKTRPGSLVREIDPAIEAMILRCIEEDPRARPASVHEIMAALPSSDPLQAAVAAGETPSPEMVAAAGQVGALERTHAWAMLTGFVVLLVVAAMLRERTNVTWYVDEIKSPAVLVEHARAAIRAAGYIEKPGDWAAYFRGNSPYVARYLKANPDAKKLPPAAVPFLYRDSAELLTPLASRGAVIFADPPPITPGMTTVLLDSQALLLELRRVPPERAPREAAAPDWKGLFSAAGLDPTLFRETNPEWNSPVPSDRRQAWIGTLPTPPDVSVRVEAASMAGRPVWFVVLGPWSTPVPLPASQGGHARAAAQIAGLLFAAAFARRNVLRGRGDTTGARRVAAFTIIVAFISFALKAHHTASLAREWTTINTLIAMSLFVGLRMWLGYLALEPYVRRRWPKMLVGWTRAVGGRFRDPLVGADVLAGLLIGAAGTVANAIVRLMVGRLGDLPWTNPLAGAEVHHFGGTASVLFTAVMVALVSAFSWTTLLVVLRIVLRKDAAAWAGVFAIIVVSIWGATLLLTLKWAVAAYAALIYVVAMRFRGLLTVVAALFMSALLQMTPFTFSGDAAYVTRSALMLLVLVSLAAYAFYISLGGKALFAPGLVEDEAAA